MQLLPQCSLPLYSFSTPSCGNASCRRRNGKEQTQSLTGFLLGASTGFCWHSHIDNWLFAGLPHAVTWLRLELCYRCSTCCKHTRYVFLFSESTERLEREDIRRFLCEGRLRHSSSVFFFGLEGCKHGMLEQIGSQREASEWRGWWAAEENPSNGSKRSKHKKTDSSEWKRHRFSSVLLSAGGSLLLMWNRFLAGQTGLLFFSVVHRPPPHPHPHVNSALLWDKAAQATACSFDR